MKKLYHSLYLNNRLFYCLGIISIFFVIGFFIPLFFKVAQVCLFTISALTIIDVFIVYSESHGVEVVRSLPERLSNGDENKITLEITNNYKFSAHIKIIEELPHQFQKRGFYFKPFVKSKEVEHIQYALTPNERGIYNFGHVNTYVSSPLQLATKKYILGEEKEVQCYPSFLRLREFKIKAFADTNTYGTKKTRRIGHSLEFEQIKEYVSGDDIRTLNWKATAKRNQLMVNQYIEEKSQPVYTIIDKGRSMQMPFNGLTLLDYAINATLAVSNAVLRKQDKAGMLSFSNKIEDLIVAEQRNSQMNLISEALYTIKTNFFESDFSQLYAVVKRKITHRSLLILYTNFETMDALKRQLPYLRGLAKNHLLLVVFFKNTELNALIDTTPSTIQDVYDSIIAEKFMYEKRQIVNELKKYGIQSVLTKPENLTSDTINRYLDFKARGLA
ncbi:DUF58 domain-containing protein [Flavobacteriaceae bacterium S356]|uniref:DUF58 domain-containing protein n=1 Tax=Asprobacillus argus TaxID=3076534 RepID=A0ABU3LD83_9FLAO|nr:DUF58 domain-containing protein [Flavobacteriaceae bacterium S356]